MFSKIGMTAFCLFLVGIRGYFLVSKEQLNVFLKINCI